MAMPDLDLGCWQHSLVVVDSLAAQCLMEVHLQAMDLYIKRVQCASI
jgi:hypothetical protein